MQYWRSGRNGYFLNFQASPRISRALLAMRPCCSAPSLESGVSLGVPGRLSHSFGGPGSVRPGLRRGGLAPGWLAGAVLRTRLCQHCQGVSSSHPAVGSLSPWPVLPHPSLPHHPPLPIGSVLCFLSLVTNFGGEGTARVTAPSCATSTETQETHGGTFLLFPHLEIVHRLFW